MKVSYKWLQTFFKNPLPEAEKISELFNTHLAEVESIERNADDVILDVNILPDRAPYLLSHQGIASEIAALIDNPFIPRDYTLEINPENVPAPEVEIENADFCDRYAAVGVMNISGIPTPAWLSDRLHSVGQRSINFIVDLLNFIMLDIGEPMHAFDAEKVEGKICVRKAKEGEKITTLDNKEVTLTPEDYVVADDMGPLAIAGIKGGKRAEVSLHTERIIVEAAHFKAETVRKTGVRVGIKNDSSKRFENNVSATLPPKALSYFLNLLSKEDSGIAASEIVDVNYFDEKKESIEVSFEFINQYLGVEIGSEEVIEKLNRASLPAERHGENVLVNIPTERRDIVIKEDIADEVGRLIGYDRVQGVLPDIGVPREVNKEISWKNVIKNFFIEKGFSEVYTYALTHEGDVQIENPLASDKGFMRHDLSVAMETKLTENLRNADLLGLSKIKMFEIGKIFPKEGERTSLCAGIAYKKVTKDSRPNDEIKDIRDELFKTLGLDVQILCTVDDTGGIISHKGKTIGHTNNKDGVMEFDLDYVISLLPNIAEERALEKTSEDVKYKPVSIYPFVSRDIAVFVPGPAGKENIVLEIIKKFAGDLLVRADLFDVFTKPAKDTEPEKTSYAYRVIFQSHEKTLEEKDINEIMDRITRMMNDNPGWKVR